MLARVTLVEGDADESEEQGVGASCAKVERPLCFSARRSHALLLRNPIDVLLLAPLLYEMQILMIGVPIIRALIQHALLTRYHARCLGPQRVRTQPACSLLPLACPIAPAPLPSSARPSSFRTRDWSQGLLQVLAMMCRMLATACASNASIILKAAASIACSVRSKTALVRPALQELSRHQLHDDARLFEPQALRVLCRETKASKRQSQRLIELGCMRVD